MHLLVAPVSGGAFPVQLAYMLELAKIKRKDSYYSQLPLYDVAAASSGGNVATYIALGGDFREKGIVEIVKKLQPSLFLSSWWPQPLASILPSWVLGYYKGSIYYRGIGINQIFQENFTPSSVGRLEIWTGTLNRTTGKAEIFTNIAPGESKLKVEEFKPDKLNAMPLHYLCRDLDVIAKVSYASAAIPLLIPGVKIGSSLYVDGGTAFSSPLTPLQDCIVAAGHKGGLHIDYLSSYNLESEDKPGTYKNLYENGTITLAEIMKAAAIQDRLSGIEILRECSGYEEGCCDENILEEIFRRRSHYNQSMLELYPREAVEICLENFTPDDIFAVIEKAKIVMMYRFWWVEK